MIELTHIDKKILTGFFSFFLFLFFIFGTISVLSSSVAATTHLTSSEKSFLVNFLPSELQSFFNTTFLTEILFLLSDIVFPFIFIFFTLRIVMRRVPLFSSFGGEENQKIIFNFIPTSIALIVVGNHLMSILGITPLLIDPIQILQQSVPGIVVFVSTFFLVSLMTGVFDTTERQLFSQFINKIMIILGGLIFLWILVAPFSNLILNFLRNLGWDHAFSFVGTSWISLVTYVVLLVVAFLILKSLGIFGLFKDIFSHDGKET